MSNIEEVSQPSNLLSKLLSVQVGGSSTTSCPNLVIGCSRIVGVVRTVSSGVPSAVAIYSITGPAHNFIENGATVVLHSADNDTSQYTLLWVNDKTQNALLC
jgi:hypothetical protein